MSDASLMMSEGLIEKVDMSQFYDLMPADSQFTCQLSFIEASFNLSVSSFKKTSKGHEILFLCNSDIVELLISSTLIESIKISRNDKEIFLLTSPQNEKIEFEINYIQDISSQVKITLNN